MGNGDAGLDLEHREAADALRKQALALPGPVSELVRLLKRKPLQVVVVCARGSSGHAATFAKHLIERHVGIPVAPAAPSIVTLYSGQLRLHGQLFLAISQSGQSDDIVEYAMMAKRAGAITAAIVNDTRSPVAACCDLVLPIDAGSELSVAATKTFVGALGVLLRLVAAWTKDRMMANALDELPDRVMAATSLDWSAAERVFAASESLATIGRGPTLAIAREAALKLKEIGNVHAEAFSGAEFLHGPVSLVDTRFPLLLFIPGDAAAGGMRALAADLRQKGASVWTTEAGDPARGQLPILPPRHPDVDAVCLIQSFYALAIRVAKSRGIDIERPRHLQKVTRTR